jgi:hypothetical protein
VTLPATADCFTGGTGGGCYISQDFVLVNCDCEGTFFQAEGSQSGGSSTNWSLEIQGPEYIFVGTDPKVVPGNFYVLTSKSGGLPQPSGGQFSVSSSEPTDSFAYGTYNGAPKVTITTTKQSTAADDRTLTFTYTSGDVLFRIYKYVTAREFAYLKNPDPSNLCLETYGVDKTYVYTVYTHPDGTALNPADDALSGTYAPESFNPSVSSCGVTTGPGALDQNLQIQDHILYCSNSPLPCSITSTQTISVGGFQVRNNTLTFTSTGVTYTSNGPTQ